MTSCYLIRINSSQAKVHDKGNAKQLQENHRFPPNAGDIIQEAELCSRKWKQAEVTVTQHGNVLLLNCTHERINFCHMNFSIIW